MNTIKFSFGTMVEFLEDLVKIDKKMKKVSDSSRSAAKKQEAEMQDEWSADHNRNISIAGCEAKKVSGEINTCRGEMDRKLADNCTSAEKSIYDRLQKCRQTLAEITLAELTASASNIYPPSGTNEPKKYANLTVDDLLHHRVDFISYAVRLSRAAKNGGKTREMAREFYRYCRDSEELLNKEIQSLYAQLYGKQVHMNNDLLCIAQSAQRKERASWQEAVRKVVSFSGDTRQRMDKADRTREELSESAEKFYRMQFEKLTSEFLKKFPPEEFLEDYRRIYAAEPVYNSYQCCEQQPVAIRIGTLEFDLTSLKLENETITFLNRNYPFMCRGKNKKLCAPDITSFGADFNYLFRFAGNAEKKNAVKDACDIGLRLFTMIPPGKVQFTFADPISAGESFAMFGQLVDEDDRTIEIINGRIWFSPADIEQKLKTMIDHTSNVIQRCLKGRYQSIFEYNETAEQNAEAYQVLMLMDFPAGMTDQSLKYLEQIVTIGPKCGVFTILFQNGEQYQKYNQRSIPLIENIENRLRTFDYAENGNRIFCTNQKICENLVYWKPYLPLNDAYRNQVTAVLKKGIKTADKVVIGIEKINERAEVDNTTENGIRIPIGIHGANEVQYLTLGVGGSHHALIAGVTGSGKSSLLHTIILRALTQYSPDELIIYLVDFKRGVEFKIYADYVLPSFKVVAIESEREFGYNILTAIEREQKVRADMFKKSRNAGANGGSVDKIEEYRAAGNKMPRILVIMDEFHELFSGSGDEISRKSAEIMERIVRQGRAFGVHLLLSSQSYSNISGIDKAVFDQMAVRIVLKSSKADAELLLENGSSEIDQISIDDPGRAIYNSEAGNRDYNSHFRVAYIDPAAHRDILEKISEDTKKYEDPKRPTRILLSNIEDNRYSIFKQFTEYNALSYKTPDRLYLGEPLSINNSMVMDLTRSENANLLMIGSDTDKARSMFTFAVLSLCINYEIMHDALPDQPFITVYNCKPLIDDYFKDTLHDISEMLAKYVCYVSAADEEKIQNELSRLYDLTQRAVPEDAQQQYFLVFGYQRADALKSEKKLSQTEDIDELFNILQKKDERPEPKQMFTALVEKGAAMGVHTLLWQDSFQALYQDERDIMSYFNLKVAFDMKQEEYSRFVGENDTGMMNKNDAIYASRAQDNQKFRPYQSPDEEWLKEISDELNQIEKRNG